VHRQAGDQVILEVGPGTVGDDHDGEEADQAGQGQAVE
jgi:hypothetical protein